jgi:hypothetical protein
MVENGYIAEQRLFNQGIERSAHIRPENIVSWFGAIQAQDYPAAKWALALRLRGATTDQQIDRLLNNGTILRTHVMRPTWHFVTPKDICWMLDLTAARVQRALNYTCRQFEIDTALRKQATKIFEHALRDGSCLTRKHLGEELARKGIVAKGIRLALLTIHAELEQIICSGPRQGKELTYSLLPLRAPHAVRLSRDESIAELVRRYFQSHGPGTIRDFVWWSGLTSVEAKRGLEINEGRSRVVDGLTYWTVGDEPTKRRQDGAVHLLPVYDEYVVAYRDLQAVPRKSSYRPGILPQALIVQGQIAGTWKRVSKAGGFTVEVVTDPRLTELQRRAIDKTLARYRRFLNADFESVQCTAAKMGSS